MHYQSWGLVAKNKSGDRLLALNGYSSLFIGLLAWVICDLSPDPKVLI